MCKVEVLSLGLHAQPLPKVKIRLIRLFFLLAESVDELRFSDELLLVELVELASDDVLFREVLKLAAPTISSRRTSQSGEVV